MQSKAILESTAYHESGHAVMYDFLGVGWKYISLDPNWDDGTLGHVQGASLPKNIDLDCYTHDRTRLYIEKQIIIAFAGGIAEELFTGRHNLIGCNSDHHNLVSLVSRISLSEPEQQAYMNWLQLRTRDLLELKQNWDRVEALAKALVALPEGKRLMSAPRARRIFAAALDERYGPLDTVLSR